MIVTQGRILRDSAPKSLVLPNVFLKKKANQDHRDPELVRILRHWIKECFYFSSLSMPQCYKITKLRDKQFKKIKTVESYLLGSVS